MPDSVVNPSPILIDDTLKLLCSPAAFVATTTTSYAVSADKWYIVAVSKVLA
jgi:hypothetical protein